jgi:hypothetical protein
VKLTSFGISWSLGGVVMFGREVLALLVVLGLQDEVEGIGFVREVGVMGAFLLSARCASTLVAACGAGITSCRSVATATLSLSLNPAAPSRI